MKEVHDNLHEAFEKKSSKYRFLPIDFEEDICTETTIGEVLSCTGHNCNNIYIRHTAHYKDSYRSAEEDLHVHDYYELSMPIKGSFAMNINGNIYKVNIGDIVVYRPGEPHFGTNIETGDIDYIEFDIPVDVFDNIVGGKSFLRCFEDRPFCERNIISPGDNERNLVMKLARKLISNMNTGDENKLLIYSYFIQFMYTVNEIFDTRSSSLSDRYIPDAVYAGIGYIRENLVTMQNLDELAAYVGVSVSYLCRIFKSYLKMSPHQYIINQRIEYAKVLLDNTDLNVSQVCYKAGFNDYSGFISIFRKKVGMTPLGYKKKF